MNVQAAIEELQMPKWPSKLLTVVIVAVGVLLLYFDGAVAVSLTLTYAGLWEVVPIVYLFAAVGIPIGVARRSRQTQDHWNAIRRAALVSVAMNLAVLPYVVLTLSV
jgi:hypothetical protein